MRSFLPIPLASLAFAALPAARGAIEITNGDFQADFAQTSNVTSWFDTVPATPANWWEATWAGPNVSPNGTSVLGLSYMNGQTNWAYQSIGTNSASLAALHLRFDAGSFTDAPATRELGVMISIYKSDGTFVPADNMDIAGAAGVTLLDSFSWSASVEPGQMVTGIQAALDLSEAGPDDELFLRLQNFAGAVGEPWTAVDNLLVVADVPVFATQPADQFGTVGSTVTLTAEAVSEPPPAYQWQFSADGTDPWEDLDGETSATLVLDPAGYDDNGYYRLVADNGSATAVSDEVLVDVVYPNPAIVSEPEGGAVQVDSDVSFTVEATGLGTLEYQWFKVDGGALTDGGRISGATTPTLTITGVQAGDAGIYYVEVNDRAATEDGLGGADGFTNSGDVVLEVFEAPASDLLSFEPFISYPYGGTLTGRNPSVAGYDGPWLDETFGDALPVVSEDTLTWSGSGYAAAIGGKAAKGPDATAISAANSGRAARLLATELKASGLSGRTLYLSWLFRTGNENSAPDADIYQVLGLWNGTSADDSLRAFEAGIAVTEFGTPNYAFRVNNSAEARADLGVAPDSDVHLFVAKFVLSPDPGGDSVTVWLDPATGAGEPTGGATVAGVDLAFDRITLSDYASNSSEWDEIRWGATFEAVTTASPDVPLVPDFTLQPVDHFGSVGETFSLTAVAEGDPAPNYQWEFDDGSGSGFVELDGETGSSLVFNPATFAANGFYRVIATNGNGEAVSDVVQVSLVYPPPTITDQPESVAVFAGSPAQLGVSATGLGELGYQWFKVGVEGDQPVVDGGTVSGATTATLRFSSVGDAEAGTYYVIVTDDAAVADEGFPTEASSEPATVRAASVLLTSSPDQPATDVFDRFYFPGEVADVDNVTAGDDAATYIAFDRAAQGMTFTTGSDPLGYSLSSITIQHVISGPTYYDVQPGDTFEFSFGLIEDDAKSVLFQADDVPYLGDPVAGLNVPGTGRFFTFDLSQAGIGTLDPDTTYYFEITTATGDAFFEWNGTAADGLAGGTAFSGGTVAAIDGSYAAHAGDRAFHVDLAGLSGPPEGFDSWIAAYPGVGTRTGFDDDADGDGLDNGIEYYLGTDPSASNAGITQIAKSGNTFTFQHPADPSPPEDVTAAYLWSTDLVTWHPSGATVGGTTVVFAASPDSPVAGVTTVTATASGTPPARLFAKLRVTRGEP